MKRILTISAFCFLFSALAFGQFNFSDLAFQPKPVAAASSSYSVTNVAGYNVAAWYQASDYITNGSTVELPDRTGKGQKMTQATASKFPVFNASGLNSLATISFDSAQGLKVTTGATNNPYSAVLVMRTHEAGINDYQYIFGDGSSTRPMFGYSGNVRSLIFDLDYTFGVSDQAMTNKWMIYELVWEGASFDRASTNNVTLFNKSTVTSRVLTGWALGERAATGRYSKFDLAELIIYAGSGLPYSNSVARADLFNYLTNRYNISP